MCKEARLRNKPQNAYSNVVKACVHDCVDLLEGQEKISHVFMHDFNCQLLLYFMANLVTTHNTEYA